MPLGRLPNRCSAQAVSAAPARLCLEGHFGLHTPEGGTRAGERQLGLTKSPANFFRSRAVDLTGKGEEITGWLGGIIGLLVRIKLAGV